MSLYKWTGTRVRKGESEGTVTEDMNGIFRVLKVFMDNGSEDKIYMANMGEDPVETKQWEWWSDRQCWCRF